ncbi:hypothetical protein AB0395_39585 [Streptosporangium sp. NPDC051023]|uniref:hypothetical protein n=1 Tax=Streptosporangium sp. NPDC051023 TaxID=3155410 RepID=UPI003450E761
MSRADVLEWHAHARVEKWDDEQVAWVQRVTGVVAPAGDLLAAHIAPYEVIDAPGNLLTTAGLTRLTSLLTGGGGQAATNTATRLGVGDGSTTAAVGDTDLSAASGSTHRYFQVMDATYPQVAAGVVTFKSTYDASTANFVWSEWGIDIGTPTVSGGTTVNAALLNHKSSAALGTKSGGSWALTATITLS